MHLFIICTCTYFYIQHRAFLFLGDACKTPQLRPFSSLLLPKVECLLSCTNLAGCVQEQGRPGRSEHDQQIYLLVLQGKEGHTGGGELGQTGGGIGSVYDPHSGFPAGFIQGPPGPPGPAGRKVRHWRGAQAWARSLYGGPAVSVRVRFHMRLVAKCIEMRH